MTLTFLVTESIAQGDGAVFEMVLPQPRRPWRRLIPRKLWPKGQSLTMRRARPGEEADYISGFCLETGDKLTLDLVLTPRITL